MHDPRLCAKPVGSSSDRARQFKRGLLGYGTSSTRKEGQMISGCVVSIIDGDTLVILESGEVQDKVRLAGIDAPEHNQDFGQSSKQNLARLIFGKNVWCVWRKTDRYGRTVGVIYLGGQDINLEQIKSGLAWHYKEYEKEQDLADRKAYSSAEEDARAKHLQIWSIRNPTPPWEFRHQRGRERSAE